MTGGSDHAVVESIARVLTRPRADEPDSFVLHAPLELLARAALLPLVSHDLRAPALERITEIGARFEQFGPPADEPPSESFANVGDAARALVEALSVGDLDAATTAGRFLGRTLDADALTRTVAPALAPSLAAAAHGPIFLHHLPRSMSRSPVAGAMFGTLAREVARHPEWRLRWFEHPEPHPSTLELGRALASTPVIGSPGSDFIFPLMNQAESSGLAADIVGPAIDEATDLAEATTAILRVSTASMLLDDPAHAPYGWTHCLTLPQAVLSSARVVDDATTLVQIAATHVVGFRCALGHAPLDTLGDAARRLGDHGLVTGLEPLDPRERQEVIDHAATHPDAHLVKYVVSCLDAARVDPVGATQHVRAAEHLSRWWREQDRASD